jgi:hypothetical protein
MKSIVTRDNVVKAAATLNPGWTLRQWALGGAWFFALASLFPLFWVASEGSAGRVFGATDAAGVDHGILLLNYSGFLGATLLWAEIIALIAAIVFTVLPLRRAKKVGHGYLIAWSAWWTLGTAYLAAYSPLAFGIQSLLLAALFACTVYRATDALRRRPIDEATEPAIDEVPSQSVAIGEPIFGPSQRVERIEVVPASPAVSVAVPATPLVAGGHDVDLNAATIDVDPSWKNRITGLGRDAAIAVKDIATRIRTRGMPATRRTASRLWRRLRDGYRSVTSEAPRVQQRA